MDLGKLLNNDNSPSEGISRNREVNNCFDNFQSSANSHVSSEARLSALYYGRQDKRITPQNINRAKGSETQRREFRRQSRTQDDEDDDLDMKKKLSDGRAQGLTERQLEQKKRQLKNEMERKRVYKTNDTIDRMRQMLQDANRRTKPDKYSTLIDMCAYVRELQQENMTLKNRLAALLRTGGNTGDPGGGGETDCKEDGSESKLQSSVSGSSNTADLSSRSSSNGDDCGSNAASTNSGDDTPSSAAPPPYPPGWKRQRMMDHLSAAASEEEGDGNGGSTDRVLNLLVGGGAAMNDAS